MMHDTARCRAIVKRASQSVKNKATKSWLFQDDKGFWEREAASLIAYATEKHPDMAPDVVDEQAALNIARDALTAMLDYARKVKQ